MNRDTKRAIAWTVGFFAALGILVLIGLQTGEINLSPAS
jgi:hypothetical protein